MTTSLSVLLVLFLAMEVYLLPLTPPQHPPPAPVKMSKMRLVKTEVLLSKILDEVPEPAGHIPVEIPRSVLRVLENEEVEEEVLRDGDNLFAIPTNENTSCLNNSFCSRYEFELNVEDKPLSTFYMWLPTQEEELDMSVCISSAMYQEETCEYLKNVSETRFEIGWSIYKLPSKFAMERYDDQLLCTIEIIGPSMPNLADDKKPILVASTSTDTAERKRRSAAATANKNCTCCHDDFYVSFKQIGWTWVVAPNGFNAKMCSGKCSNQISSYRSNYHQMLSAVLSNKTLSATGDKKEDLWTPCCSPTKLSPLHMIYVAGNSTQTNSSSTFSLIYHKIPDMITESCGCW